MNTQRKQQKIELIMFKNNKKSKNNLMVKPNITYEVFLKKLSYLTQKKFRLEIKNSDGSTQQLTEQKLPKILDNYKGEHINLITNTQIVTDYPAKSEASSFNNLSINSLIERPNPHQQQEIIKILIMPIRQEIKELVKKKSTQGEQILGQSQNKENNKGCSQCHKPLKWIYYLCLKCPNQFALCAECEQKETYNELNTHKFRAHPFAKIKGSKQRIKSIDILTIQLEHISFQENNDQEKMKHNYNQASLEGTSKTQDIEKQQKILVNIEESIRQLIKIQINSIYQTQKNEQ